MVFLSVQLHHGAESGSDPDICIHQAQRHESYATQLAAHGAQLQLQSTSMPCAPLLQPIRPLMHVMHACMTVLDCSVQSNAMLPWEIVPF